uniref:Uncharacterized protein n=1 Tax=Heterorhabditis bacteriophora TaxID=37862 RepID=A0A1I7WZP2_HETBA
MVADKEMRNMIITYESMGVDSDSFGFSMDGNRQQRATKFAALMSERMYKKSQNAEFKHAYTYNDLIISCTYNAKPCNITDFTEFYDPSYGICHMFNYNGQYFSSRAGPLYGLRIVARIDQAKYLPWTEVAGVIISIHEQRE